MHREKKCQFIGAEMMSSGGTGLARVFGSTKLGHLAF